jgi:hypothetical protein
VKGISHWVGLVGGALILRTDAYQKMREARNPFAAGLVVVLIIGVIIALVGVVGTVLEWASSPNLASVHDVVYDGLTEMPWYQETARMVPDFAETFKSRFESGWLLAQWLWVPNIGTAAGNIVLTPLTMIVRWLIYGLLAHLFARLLRGEATVGQTLGCLGLAVAPQLLRLVEVLPYVSVGGVVGTWTLISRYVALKQAHRLTWGRALAATLLPTLILWLAALIIVTIGAAIVGTLASQFLGGT